MGKMLATYIAAKELLPIIYNELLLINEHKMNFLSRKWTKDMKKPFAKEIQMATNTLPLFWWQLWLLQLAATIHWMFIMCLPLHWAKGFTFNT